MITIEAFDGSDTPACSAGNGVFESSLVGSMAM